jgi:hypothetical protein
MLAQSIHHEQRRSLENRFWDNNTGFLGPENALKMLTFLKKARDVVICSIVLEGPGVGGHVWVGLLTSMD